MAHMMPPGSAMIPAPHHDHGPIIARDHRVDPNLVQKIVQQLKINGVFDEMRKECLADIDTKPAFLNLKQRVETHVKGILANQQWSPILNKNQLRSRIRESIMQSGILNEGVDRILYQVFSAKAHPVFLPKVKDFVKEKGQEMIKEFMQPPPMEMHPPPIMMNPPYGPPPPMPVPVELPDRFHPPMPDQPPLPESPGTSVVVNPMAEEEPPPPEEQQPPVPESSEEILTYEDQEFYVKDVAMDDVSVATVEDIAVKAINTPSPNRLASEDDGEGAPKIPEDVVNPLRNLIQSLLVSKKTLDSGDVEVSETVEEKVKVEDFSPTIDASQIESFTDDETDAALAKGSSPEKYSPKPVSSSRIVTHSASSPISPKNEPYSPPSIYTSLSPDQNRLDSFYMKANLEYPKKATSDVRSDDGSYETADQTTPPYDPGKFSFQQMSDSTPVNDNSNSPPSPIDVVEPQTEQSHYIDSTVQIDRDSSTYDTDLRLSEQREKRKRRKSYQRSSPDSSTLSSSDSSVQSSPSPPATEIEQNEVQPEQVIEQVEEMVEEIEVVEEFTSESAEEEKISRYESVDSDEKKAKKIPKAYQEKKKKKKTKKKKVKKTKNHKRARTSSISSGEITSSDSDSSDSSRPTRPTRPPRHEPQIPLNELEERRRVHREENIPDRPYWANTASSSEYISSPRMHRPYSPPPRRPYSPEFRRFEGERDREIGYGPRPAPPFRDRPLYRGEFRSRSRFSPPPYRRSPPPHRYSPGPRMDYPRIPFGSPRSPPRRPYSPPPHVYHGEPRPFPPPHHRWSPPRPGMTHRRPSRSPPPVMRRDDGPGPSRY